jgi:signal transduction histidine kinase
MLNPNTKQNPRERRFYYAILLVAWVAFAFWQYREYLHQRELIQGTLVAQAESLSSAVSSSLKSHRWFGPFVQQQLPNTLAVLARSKNVLAIVIVVNDDGEQAYFAGDKGLAGGHLPDGIHAIDTTLQYVDRFSVPNNPPMMNKPFAHSSMQPSQASADTEFKSIVVLDRRGVVTQIRREATNRLLIFILGSSLLAAATTVWRSTVRLAKSEGTTRLLQAEARHYQELSQAAAGLAHETRNPLGLIRGWTQRLADAGLPSDEQRQQADSVLEECDRVTARINQFLAFARQPEPTMELVALAPFIEELLVLLQPDLDARSLKIQTSLPDSPRFVLADRDQFRQVLFNLLQNAIEFAPEGSTIKVVLQSTGQDIARIEVCDEGPGVPEELMATMFDPYVTRRPGGTGLGLSIVRRIATAHHWFVGYRAAPEGGSVFWIDAIATE